MDSDDQNLEEGAVSADGESTLHIADNGDLIWRNNLGQLHRNGGPALVKKNGDKTWYCRGLIHNTKGPALISMNKGKPCYGWALHGGMVLEQKFNELIAYLEYEEKRVSEFANKRCSPVNVIAPVVINASSPEDFQPFIDFVSQLKAHTNLDATKAEKKRLEPYFQMMSKYLFSVTDLKHRPIAEKKEIRKNISPGGLAKLFSEVAAFTKNAIISDVAVLPNNIRFIGPAANIFGLQSNSFDVPTLYNGHIINFGFYQAFESGRLEKAKSSTTFPVFFVDAQMVDILPKDAAKDLLHGIKNIMTMNNHDMLHHFTMFTIPDTVVHRFRSYQDRPPDISHFFNKWGAEHKYEQWAHASHETLLSRPENAHIMEQAKQMLDKYFDTLDRVTAESQKARHIAVDYFGTVMIHILAHGLPLKHPLIAYSLDRLEKADHHAKEILLLDPDGLVTEYSKQVIQSYRQLGFDILPDDRAKIDYKNMKLLQVAGLHEGVYKNDLTPHIPSAEIGDAADVRRNVKESMLGMVTAVSKTLTAQP